MRSIYLQTTDAAVASTHDPLHEFDRAKGLEALMDEVTRRFDFLDTIVEFHARRWSRLLNGEPMDPESRAGQVIDGPWLDRT